MSTAEPSPEPATHSGEDAVPAEGASSRLERFKALQRRQADSVRDNRKDVHAEATARRMSAQESARLERKRRQAEAFAEKVDAEESGADMERKKAWEYSVEDNDKWDKKQAKKQRRAQFEFTDYDDVTRRKYKKDIDALKPDLKAYNAQRQAALGQPSTSSASGSTEEGSESQALIQQQAAESLYRDANSFVYADHKPSEEAIDRVIGKINMDTHKRNKFSRKRNEDGQDVTYINDNNKAFNKKLERFFDKYTKETRDNFERGTAL